jgi:hypothetical protein
MRQGSEFDMEHIVLEFCKAIPLALVMKETADTLTCSGEGKLRSFVSWREEMDGGFPDGVQRASTMQHADVSIMSKDICRLALK